MALPPATDDSASKASRDRRWRVVLVRVPPKARAPIEAVLPGNRRVRTSELPLVVRTTGDHFAAEDTARRLRKAGAVVLLMEEPVAGPDEGAFCAEHPARIAARACVVCARPVCTTCRREAGGEEVCGPCRRKGRTPGMRVRRRQLFVVFLFAVFVYQVVDFLRADRQAVDPLGRVRVAVFQFVPPDEPSADIVRTLNRMPEMDQSVTSLFDIADWFNSERARYGGSKDYLRVDVHGPWGREVTPPLLDDPDLPGWRLGLRAWEYARYFKGLATDQGVDPDDYAARVYVVYSRDADDLAAHSRGSERGRVAVVYVDLDERNPGYAALTVAHELAHTLGADDLYDPSTMLSMHPEGYVEPFADPLFPQRFAELMAADVPVGPRKEREVRSLDEVRVGYASAAAMGWITRPQAELFYAPAALTPAELLDLQEAESEADGPGAVPSEPAP